MINLTTINTTTEPLIINGTVALQDYAYQISYNMGTALLVILTFYLLSYIIIPRAKIGMEMALGKSPIYEQTLNSIKNIMELVSLLAITWLFGMYRIQQGKNLFQDIWLGIILFFSVIAFLPTLMIYYRKWKK